MIGEGRNLIEIVWTALGIVQTVAALSVVMIRAEQPNRPSKSCRWRLAIRRVACTSALAASVLAIVRSYCLVDQQSPRSLGNRCS